MGKMLDTYRRYRAILDGGEYDRLSEVLDENLVENCLGLTGWTVGVDTAMANFNAGYGAAFTDFEVTVDDVVESADMIAVRGRVTATHRGDFLGVPATGDRISWDYMDMCRAGDDGRFHWRMFVTDWNIVRQRMLGEAPDLPERPARRAVQQELAAARS
ncbi:ester cyclase [Kutzneria kofuensis]|uniref:Putative ester cyclase n=1 Tax=Kutzneria kofuensis TaxID=103725 RepID=A0A7W9KQR2_9PSEU|nr:ester cyclase [Kutzneria kofuensis]MBB5897002.1 putative ester cyclase [Kutzneria kofuensis]